MRKNRAFRWLSAAFALGVTVSSLGCTYRVSSPPLPAETSLPAAKDRQSVPDHKERRATRFPETLHDYLRYALEHSANLRASFTAYQAALRKRPQVTALPDPRLSYSYFIRSVETRVGPQRHRLGLAQSFPWFGTLALRGEEADLEARAELYRFLSLKNTLVFEVGKTYAELAYLYAAVRITEETLQLVRSWEEVLQVRFRSGIGSHSDLVRVQVELGQLEDRIAEFQDLIRPTIMAFNALLNRAASAPVTVTTDLLIATAFNQEAAAAGKLTAETLSLGNPELAMLDALIAARRAGRQLAEKKYYPDFTLGIDYIATDDRPARQADGKKAAREKLRLLGLTQAQIRRIEESRQADEHVTIYAPMGGVVVEKHVNEGMYVNTGTKIYTIADLTHLWIYLDAYESDLPWIRYGQAVVFQAEAFPGQEFHGIVSFVQPFLDEQTRTVRVRVNVENHDLKLKPGLFVTATINARVSATGEVVGPSYAGQYICPMHPEVVRQKPGSCPICGMTLTRADTLPFVGHAHQNGAQPPLVIPASAPLITGTRAIVYVQQPDTSQYEGRQVVLGPRAGAYYTVKEGLQEGESVVTNGSFKIDADLQICGKPSMMSPHGGKPAGGHAH